ncbi:MAG TPA: hypothetical protein VFR48_04555 [Solirubrobacteraceae bacterium]|nr:hypothetical protein [Solirubrobacteraceae bacterium]
MGLLDDAIREHLELKRLRGADPGEVARAENDALGPVRREAEVPAPASEDEDSDSLGNGGDVEAEVSAPVADTPASQSDLGAAGVGQETVEINMEAELGRQSTSSETSAPPAGELAAPVGHPAHTQPSAGDSLEWEMPGDGEPDAKGEQSTEGQPSSEEPAEDVLEETPDFLRETPEQDRLWFEQRPPRDFDFNE